MTQINQIDITSWVSERLLEFLEKIEEDVVLIAEEDIYYVLVKEKVVVEEQNLRLTNPNFYKYTIRMWINDLKKGLR